MMKLIHFDMQQKLKYTAEQTTFLFLKRGCSLTHLNLPPTDAAHCTKLVIFDIQHKLKYTAEQPSLLFQKEVALDTFKFAAN